jgi:hypothetical protein
MSEDTIPFEESDSDGDEPREYRDESAESEELSSDANLVDFGELTLAEVAGRLMREPRQTWAMLSQILRGQAAPRIERPQLPPEVAVESPETLDSNEDKPKSRPSLARLGLYFLAFVIALIGTLTMVGATYRPEETLSAGAFWLLIGCVIWMAAEIVDDRRHLNNWWNGKDRLAQMQFGARLFPVGLIGVGVIFLMRASDLPLDTDPSAVLAAVQSSMGLIIAAIVLLVVMETIFHVMRRYPSALPEWMRESLDMGDAVESSRFQPRMGRVDFGSVPLERIGAGVLGLGCTLLTWDKTAGNLFMPVDMGIGKVSVFWFWMLGVLLWTWALASEEWNPLRAIRSGWGNIRSFDYRRNRWVIVILVVILIVAAIFRLHRLFGKPDDSYIPVPPEMTSDHVEKLLDAQRVLDGTHQIFFANNGGREPFQMYAMALFSMLPGQSISFDSLKLLAVVESLVTFPVLVWMGVEVVGERNRRLGVMVGLIGAALVAVSYWHVAITRLSLRIVLTPTVTALLIAYLSRAMRHNRRMDFIKAGLVLGFGLYTYQAVRMLPVVIVIGVFLAFMKQRAWRERRQLVANFLALVIVAFIIFVPLFHYSVESPDEFWRRTAGRLLGDDVVTETLPDGTIVKRNATIEERLDAFSQNLPALMKNIRNVLLMFNWKGDVAWINGAPNYPTMDPFSGSLLVLGAAAWIALMFRRGDVVHWLIPVTVIIMLLPSALSIAYPIENPSHTRTSGALPVVYLIVALPLGLMVEQILRFNYRTVARVVSVGLCVVVVGLALVANGPVYFERHLQAYLNSSLPYSEAGGLLRDFAIGGGSYGNAFMVAYPYWWDHRAVGIEAGRVDWPNGIVRREDIPGFLRNAANRPVGPYWLDLSRDMLFFLSVSDVETLDLLRRWFPEGNMSIYHSYQEDDDFMFYLIPPLGEARFEQFLRQNGLSQ